LRLNGIFYGKGFKPESPPELNGQGWYYYRKFHELEIKIPEG
jgi:hypothetical protein